MKFIEQDLARTWNLYNSFYDNAADEYLNSLERNFIFSLFNNLFGKLEYKYGSVKYDSYYKNLIIEIIGYKDKEEIKFNFYLKNNKLLITYTYKLENKITDIIEKYWKDYYRDIKLNITLVNIEI